MDFDQLIEQKAFNQDTITKGLYYFSKNAVDKIKITTTQNQPNQLNLIASGIVVGNNGTYETMVIFRHNQLITAHCDCPAFEMWGERPLCKHLVAFLKEIEKLQNDNSPTPTRPRHNSLAHYWTEQLLRQYQPNFDNSLTTFDKVHLLPQLFYDNHTHQFYLTFTIGIKKPYVLKSLHQFADRMRNGEIFRYGKGLEFAHVRENFHQDSLFYLDLIIETNATIDTLVGLSHYYIPKGQVFGRELYLNPNNFDHFFDYHLDKTAPEMSLSRLHKDQVIFIDEDPELKITIVEDGDSNYRLNCNLSHYLLYQTLKYSYFIYSKHFYRCSESFCRIIFPILHNLKHDREEQLIFSDQQLSAFLGLVYPQAQKLVQFHIDDKIIEKLTPATLNACLYFDYPQTNSVRGRVEFYYGDIVINPLAEPEESLVPYREKTKEYQILALLLKYHFSVNEDEYLLIGEESIYEFLTEGLNELLPLAQIMVEDKLEKMKAKHSFSLSMDITMTKGIIELKFDESKFSTEELLTVIKAYQAGKKYVILKDNTFLDIVNPSTKLLNDMLTDFDLNAKALNKGILKLPAYRALYLNDLLEETPEVTTHKSHSYKDMVRDILKPIDTDFDVPAGLSTQLRQYQLLGYRWLKTLSYYNFGGILADDMGLGKTIQAIAFLLSELPEATKPSIIVAPTSLIYNWQAEITKFAPELSYRMIAGTAEDRKNQLKNIAAGEIVITSYDTLKRDIDNYHDLEFEFCIADEAQYIKNHYTQNAQSIKSLNSRVRFALTGTPMENSLADLWSIMDFVMPGYLLKWQKFKSIYEIPITRYDDRERLKHLQRQVAPFLLRRLKKDVLTELPDKIESTMYAQLNKEEEKIYHAQLAQSQKTFLEEIAANGVERSQIKILALLTRLRQACCSPKLFLDNYNQPSSKLTLCLTIINEKIQSGSQILIFSQFTTMLDLIADELKKQQIDYLILTGATKSSARMHMVSQFNDGRIPVFLISLKAGGVGLNLTAADTVIHFDPWWNISAQNQATDRAHRIGQDKKVHVIKLIAKDTIEEKIEILQNKKKNLTDAIITEGQTFLTQLNQNELEDLFSFQIYQ